jgi:O-antigen/teichoic acid export membrane protein
MRWIYSSRYGGGGGVLVVLMFAQGAWAIQGILAWALVAAGESRTLALTMVAVTVLAVPVTYLLVVAADASGAATAFGLTGTAAVAVFGLMLHRRFGSITPALSMVRIGLAGAAMYVVLILAGPTWHPAIGSGAGLCAYAAVLLVLAEISWDDLSAITQRPPMAA